MHLSIVDIAERLFRQIGFQKTSVADIAREMQMSPANVYRFFGAKSEINEAVCRRLFGEIEARVAEVAESPGPASKKLRNVIAAVKQLNTRRFVSDGKLQELFETAHKENWPIVRDHFQWMDKVFARIISRGMATGEFQTGDAELASILFRSICVNFCNSRSMGEDTQDTEPPIDQIVDFCLTALADQGHAGTFGRTLETA
jgi:AcrR family transcriptional regulator